jgi:inosine/xanthosine triphosphatase
VLTVVVGSNNPAKINAVKQAFSQCFTQSIEYIGVAAQSGVADQPLSDNETKLGALNRLQSAAQLHPNADFYVTMEAGIDSGLTYAWIAIRQGEQQSATRSAGLPLPPKVLHRIAQGEELGDVMDALFATENIKQKGGAIGLLTDHLLTRSSVYVQAIILALAPHRHPEHYLAQNS